MHKTIPVMFKCTDGVWGWGEGMGERIKGKTN